jgi:hypothetical protein
MQQPQISKTEKSIFKLINQLFEIEKKASKLLETNSIHRNIDKMTAILGNDFYPEDCTLSYENPLGEAYTLERIDLDADISGEGTDDLIVTEVLKPIIRFRQGGMTTVLQKGVVIVESKKATDV